MALRRLQLSDMSEYFTDDFFLIRIEIRAD